MPKAMLTSDSNMPYYYNVTYSVGSGGINKNLDVMMIQYMLAKIAKIYTWGLYFKAPKVNGKADTATIAAIKGFQTAYNSSFGNSALVKNGLVSPAKRESDRFTIWAINYIFHFFYEEIHIDPWSEGGDMPLELRNAMYEAWWYGSTGSLAA